MKNITIQVVKFIERLHEFITNDPQFITDTWDNSETYIQEEIKPLIINYLIEYFSRKRYINPVAKANNSIYCEGHGGTYGNVHPTTFGTRNYPDLIITYPYLIACEFKQSQTGLTVKQGIGQSIIHTLSEEFHYVYYLFHDQSTDKRIEKSITDKQEKLIVDKMWNDFNVYIKFI